MAIRSDTITDAAGTGAPNFSQGLKLAGGTSAISEYVGWTDFTPTTTATGGGSYTTGTTEFAKYHINGKIMYIAFKFTNIVVTGTVTAAGFTLPASKSHIFTGANQMNTTDVFLTQSAVDFTLGRVSLNSSAVTEVRFDKINATNFSNNDDLSGIVIVPIQ